MTREDLYKMIEDDFARPIEGCRRYFVTRDGDVISTAKYRNKNIRKIKFHTNRCGYYMCGLPDIKRDQRFTVHRLVAKTFLPNINNLREVNHKNEIKTDNRVDNLEWCTSKYNNNYGTRKERSSLSHIDGKQCKQVAQINKNGEIIKIWVSAMRADRDTGIFCFKNISASCYRKQKMHLGYVWRFINELSEEELINMRIAV